MRREEETDQAIAKTRALHRPIGIYRRSSPPRVVSSEKWRWREKTLLLYFQILVILPVNLFIARKTYFLMYFHEWKFWFTVKSYTLRMLCWRGGWDADDQFVSSNWTFFIPLTRSLPVQISLWILCLSFISGKVSIKIISAVTPKFMNGGVSLKRKSVEMWFFLFSKQGRIL